MRELDYESVPEVRDCWGLAEFPNYCCLALPFAVYAGVTSAISVAIGPVGWTLLGAGLLYKLGKPSLRKQLVTALAVAGLRGLYIELRSRKSTK